MIGLSGTDRLKIVSSEDESEFHETAFQGVLEKVVVLCFLELHRPISTFHIAPSAGAVQGDSVSSARFEVESFGIVTEYDACLVIAGEGASVAGLGHTALHFQADQGRVSALAEGLRGQSAPIAVDIYPVIHMDPVCEYADFHGAGTDSVVFQSQPLIRMLPL